MISNASLLVAGHLVLSPLVAVDFQFAPSSQDRPSVPAIAMPNTESNGPSRPVAQPRYSIARGYGNKVPLDFAARQIVPSPIKLIFGRNVDHGTAVSWIGGRPWDQVLASMLRQNGLWMRVSQGSVTIGD